MRGHMSKAKALTLVGLLAAVEVVLTLTPLGFIPLGVTKATTIHPGYPGSRAAGAGRGSGARRRVWRFERIDEHISADGYIVCIYAILCADA